VCYIYVLRQHGYARFGTAGGIIPMNRVIQGLPRTCTILWVALLRLRRGEVDEEKRWNLTRADGQSVYPMTF
jgi:hypothetical protein